MDRSFPPPSALINASVLRPLGTGILVLVAGTLALSLYVPIYTDEFAWYMVDGRFFADGLQAIRANMAPSCGPYAFALPWPLVPFHAVDAAIYSWVDDPLTFRIAGMTAATLIVAFVAGELGLALAPARKSYVALGVIAFATLGVLPFLLVLSRPEQCLLPAVALLTMRAAFNNRRPKRALGDYSLAACVFLTAAFSMITHPKALFFLPLFLVSGWLIPGRYLAKILATAPMLLIGTYAYRDWSQRTDCPGDEYIQALNSKRDFLMSIHHDGFQTSVIRIVEQNPINLTYIRKILFKPFYTSTWLPGEISLTEVRDAIDYVIVLGYCSLLLFGLLAFLIELAQVRRLVESRRSVIVLASLWTGLWANALGQTARNDYDATLMVPLFAIASILSIRLNWKWFVAKLGFQLNRIVKYAFLGLLGLSIISQSYLLSTFLPQRSTWAKGGYIANQPSSISGFGYESKRNQIVDAARRCGIVADRHPKRLVVDEMTLLSFASARQPILMTGMDPRGWGRNIKDPTALLREIGSEGMIIGCQSVPAALTMGTIQTGDFCCHNAFQR